MLVVQNHHVIVPRTQEMGLFMANSFVGNCTVNPRNADEQVLLMSGTKVANLNFKPVNPYWVEIYLKGRFTADPGEYGVTAYSQNLPEDQFGCQELVDFTVTGVAAGTTLYYSIEPVQQTDVDYDYYGDFTRVLNPKYPTRKTAGIPFENYNITGNTVIFNKSVQGYVKIISDRQQFDPYEQGVNGQKGLIIPINNIQSYDTYEKHFVNARWAGGNEFSANSRAVNPLGITNSKLKARVGDALYAEPFALTQPCWGYVRPTGDRRGLIYVPTNNFKGYDSFHYTLMTQRGQAGIPQCVHIKVEDQGDTPRLTLAVSNVSVIEGNSITVTLETRGLCQGVEYNYTISGTGITATDFFNLRARPGVYSLGAVYNDDLKPIAYVENCDTLRFNATAIESNVTLYYSIEDIAPTAAIGGTLTGTFIPTGICDGSRAQDTILVRVYPDYVPEGDEIFTIRLDDYPSVYRTVTIKDLVANYTISSDQDLVGAGSEMFVTVTSVFSSELLDYTIDNADGKPIGYSITPNVTVI